MGSIVEINDSLVITQEQGFPKELDLVSHLKVPLKAENFVDKIFEFKNKKGARVYHIPPVRNFLVEKTKEGKWIYWGLVHVLEVVCDHESKITSGKFKIIHINTPEQMKQAHGIIDRDPTTSYFS